MDYELFGQSRVDKLYEKIRGFGIRYQTTDRIEQAVGYEASIFGREDNGKQFLFETESRHAEHDGHEQAFHNSRPQHVEMVPKRLFVSTRRHPFTPFSPVLLYLSPA